jgi:CRP/FNR family transcriptional regulator
MITADQLRKYPFFAGLSNAELTALTSCISKRTVAKGAYLYHPGNPGLYTYLVESGMVRLFFNNAQGQEFVLNLVGPGEVFGLPLWQEQQSRVLGAAALLPTVVLVIKREDLFHFMERFPTLMHNIYQELATNARNLTLRVRALTTLSLKGRLARLLLRLNAKDKTGENKSEIYLPLNQGELAGWLGVSRGRLNRAVRELMQLGLIRNDGPKYVVLDREGLERIIQEPVPEPDL